MSESKEDIKIEYDSNNACWQIDYIDENGWSSMANGLYLSREMMKLLAERLKEAGF
ncbi:MAG: hypothetical protein M1285_02890 [Candidatus Thermoplasmatota archaeon]|nr:hypothetical protein [Candidatus Thermoplasmatota archaeon]